MYSSWVWEENDVSGDTVFADGVSIAQWVRASLSSGSSFSRLGDILLCVTLLLVFSSLYDGAITYFIPRSFSLSHRLSS